jgi:hypothetical protein
VGHVLEQAIGFDTVPARWRTGPNGDAR